MADDDGQRHGDEEEYDSDYEPPPWANSRARTLLERDISEGYVPPDMPPQEVIKLRKEYRPYKKGFGGYLRTLRGSVTALKNYAASDAADLEHDLQLNPPSATNARGCPRWHGSAAERDLKVDVAEGKHATMSPGDLFHSRQAYEAFPKAVFDKHVHQEKRSQVETKYWRAQREKAAAKANMRHEKALEKAKKDYDEKKKRDRKKEETWKAKMEKEAKKKAKAEAKKKANKT